MLNFILKEMFSRADLVDMYSLADPTRCKKFIVVAADALEKLFVKIRLYPQKDRQGILYFQSIDGLTKATTAAAQEAQAVQRKYCLELAFFFIRIFQTFAALYLTIFDTTLPPTDLPDDIPSPSATARRATFIDPKTFLGAQVGVQPRGFFGTGGALVAGERTIRSTFYLRGNIYAPFLNKILSPPDDAESITAPMRFSRYSVLRIKQDSLYTFTGNDPRTRTTNPNPTPFILYSNADTGASEQQHYLKAQLNIQASGEKFIVSLTNIQDIGGSGKKIDKYSATLDESGIVISNEFSKARGKELDTLIYEMMLAAEIAIYGEPELPVVKFLSRFGYTSAYGDRDMPISGSSVYINRGQEKLGRVRVVFMKDVTLPDETKKTSVRIPGSLEIEKIQPFPQAGNKYSYKVRLTFDKAGVTPRALQEALAFPESSRAVTFSASSDSIAPHAEQGDYTIPEFLERRFMNLVMQQADEIEDRSGIKYTRQGFPTPVDTADIPEDLRVKALWKALAKDPPIKSHCVARATQLLSVAAIRGQVGETAFSSACRLTFRYQKDGSLPTPGEPITKEHGLMALATLFVETLEAGVPKITDKPRYLEFLKRLRYLFEKYPSLEAAPPAARVGEITERSVDVCKTVGDSPIQVNQSLGRDLKGVAQRLMSQQQAHIGAAMGLIFKLFDRDAITRRRVFALNRAVLTGGTPAVNAVAAEARDLLLRYYTDCETTYREGLVKIYQSSLTAPLQAVGAASGAPAQPASPARPA